MKLDMADSTYDMIGGLDKQMQEIKEVIELLSSIWSSLTLVLLLCCSAFRHELKYKNSTE